ncbi:sugar phosphate isomerase/epimerase family protein [Halegenticoccus tardaugens]|uniref:sugar phosphate isomerase/epimerase family protein n=1 Tax=Halegenticoccus tardaugens TaxID=2071624 RepID=UPI00100AB317|nr:sugar phosphate isomerase/epimerase family protein [Halegenticoccus tardaugens]
MGHRYGLNQAGFPTSDFRETCENLSRAGYDGVEPNYTGSGPLTSTAGRERLAATATEFDLDVPAVSTTLHWEYPLSSDDPSTRRKGLEIARGMIDAASVLGADDVLIVPAVVDPGTNYERAHERAVASVRELVTYAADTDVRVAIENVQNDFLYSPIEFDRFLETVSDAGTVAAYFDVGNGFRWGLPDRWIRELSEWIAKVHVKDWLTEAHRPTYPLQGDIDWQSVASALTDIGYEGWITAEVPAYPSSPERMPKQVLENVRHVFEPK